MTTFTTWQHNVLDNPVARREWLTLRRGRSKWFWRGAVGITFFLAILPLLNGYNRWFHQTLSTTSGLLVFANMAVFGAVVLRTVTVATDSVIREKRGQTWELLALTGSGVGRIVLGKWFGTMRFMLRDYLWLFVIRAVLFFWMLAIHSTRGWDWRDIENMTLANVTIDVERLLLGLAIVGVFGILELMLSSALGLATAFFPWSHRAGVWSALVARIGLAAAFGFGVFYVVGMIRPYPYTIFYSDEAQHFLISFAGALGDNSAISAASILMDEQWRPEEYMVLGLLAAVPVYMLFTGAGLAVAHYTAYRQGANVGGLMAKSKPKRAYTMPESASLPQESAPKSEPQLAAATASAANIFALPNPEQYRVEIFHYQRHLSRLLLRATSERETVYLQFSGVAYLDVPSAWQGGNFRVGTAAEYQQMMQAASVVANMITADSLRLYLVDGTEKPLRLMATNALLLRELHDSIA